MTTTIQLPLRDGDDRRQAEVTIEILHTEENGDDQLKETALTLADAINIATRLQKGALHLAQHLEDEPDSIFLRDLPLL